MVVVPMAKVAWKAAVVREVAWKAAVLREVAWKAKVDVKVQAVRVVAEATTAGSVVVVGSGEALEAKEDHRTIRWLL
jgi:hypothetical protein